MFDALSNTIAIAVISAISAAIFTDTAIRTPLTILVAQALILVIVAALVAEQVKACAAYLKVSIQASLTYHQASKCSDVVQARSRRYGVLGEDSNIQDGGKRDLVWTTCCPQLAAGARVQHHTHPSRDRAIDFGTAHISDSKMPALVTLRRDIFQVFVRILSGKTFGLDAQSSDTITNVLSKIQHAHGLQQNQHHIVFCGKTLEGNRTLSSYNIQHQESLQLKPRLPGGMDKVSNSTR